VKSSSWLIVQFLKSAGSYVNCMCIICDGGLKPGYNIFGRISVFLAIPLIGFDISGCRRNRFFEKFNPRGFCVLLGLVFGLTSFFVKSLT